MEAPKLTKLEYFTYDPTTLKAARISAGKSMQDLATDLDVHYRTIERIEKGRAGSYDTAAKYCRFVGLNPLLIIIPADAPPEKRRGAPKKFRET